MLICVTQFSFNYQTVNSSRLCYEYFQNALNLPQHSPKMNHVARSSVQPLGRSVPDPFKLYLGGHIFLERLRGKGEIAFIIEERKRDAGRRDDVAGAARAARGRPINPQQATSYPLYKVIFLAPALNTVRVPSKFPTIDRTTLDHRNDQSVLTLLRKTRVSLMSSVSHTHVRAENCYGCHNHTLYG